MCGLAGLLDPRGTRDGPELSELVASMAATLVHRGPDDGGTWADPETGIALGSRRLAVIDLSEQGHQPMCSASGRYVIAFNGEIYNFRRLRERLDAAGHAFRGHSDTEVLLATIEERGLAAALAEVNGMFAFALWDRRQRTLHLARDRLGEKPLYYGWAGDTLVFASELKALHAFPRFAAEIDRESLRLFLRYRYVPAPRSIYRGVYKLPPAHTLSFTVADVEARAATPRAYWSAFDVAAEGAARPASGSPESLADELEQLLGDAIEMRLVADVPVGAFLSGGIDSSTVVALMRRRSRSPVRTFTIGYDDPSYDESAQAAAVARHLGTEHIELRTTAADARAVIPRLPALYDEPFADTSQIPTFLVSQLAREHVTVALSGDGGDELFGGYNRHTWGGTVWNASSRVPLAARRAVGGAISAVPPAVWEATIHRLAPLLPERARVRNPGIKMQKLAAIIPSRSADDLYVTLVSHWQRQERLVVGVAEEWDGLGAGRAPAALGDLGSQMMFLDLVTYLPDDILVKVDRATMGVSLEARVPMLDHRLVELAWRVPQTYKINQGTGKWLLRKVLARHVPDDLVNRPKMGFGLPVGAWLRGPLRSWADDLLDPGLVARQGYLLPDVVSSAWQRHLSGRVDLEDKLWAVLMFQSWLETWG
jgi:asparagine synthase (glutamine-hydrolysing)